MRDIRKPYRDSNDKFTKEDLIMKEPIGQFRHWFDEAQKTAGVLQANAMCLATANKFGIPSARMVLLKGYGPEGFRFYTNYAGRKGRELLENPNASLVFFWDPLDRQVRIEGTVQKMSDAESDKYFQSRPRPSQISAAVSKQSAVIKQEELQQKYDAMSAEYADESVPIPRPDTWGGFLLTPKVVEFFQGHTNRLHDRIRFRKLNSGEVPDDDYVHCGEDGWVYEYLSP